MAEQTKRYNPAFARFVTRKREAAGFSKTQYGPQLGISPSYLAQIEEGLVPRRERLVRMAQTIGDDVDQWLRAAGYAVEEEAADSEIEIDPKTRAVPEDFAEREGRGDIMDFGEVHPRQSAEGSQVEKHWIIRTDTLRPEFASGDLLEFRDSAEAPPGAVVLIRVGKAYRMMRYAGAEGGRQRFVPANVVDLTGATAVAKARVVAVLLWQHRAHAQ